MRILEKNDVILILFYYLCRNICLQDNTMISILTPLHNDIILPERLNCPFYYQPHPICLAAVDSLQNEIEMMEEWKDEISKGKMFGVLVVKDDAGDVSYLKAYSGQIGGREDWDGWVPAVFNYLQPDGFFVKQEAEITRLNVLVNDMQKSNLHRINCARLATITAEQHKKLDVYRQFMASEKAQRERKRMGGANVAVLIKESQFQKAELKRLKQKLESELLPYKKVVSDFENEILRLKAKRKAKSDSLQRWLFSQFVLMNGLGEKKDLLEIFKDTPQGIPPSGAGECCAPKLLQYAFLNNLQPLSLAEFWWGQSPIGEIRRHLSFYPACQGKCKPILDFMLHGVDVESNPLEMISCVGKLDVVYSDKYLVVVNKPAGLLAVPGRCSVSNAQDVLSLQLLCDVYPVHRLDMQTSGLLMFALSENIQSTMRVMFASRMVKKKYVAVLDGLYEGPTEGMLSLPLSSDYLNRPRQRVDYEEGKESVTYYKIMFTRESYTYIELYPHTGRTHQLRVHCAYKDGLGIPIVGDDLYGTHADRLLLHAETLDFVHPVTKNPMHIECKHTF